MKKVIASCNREEYTDILVINQSHHEPGKLIFNLLERKFVSKDCIELKFVIKDCIGKQANSLLVKFQFSSFNHILQWINHCLIYFLKNTNQYIYKQIHDISFSVACGP